MNSAGLGLEIRDGSITGAEAERAVRDPDAPQTARPDSNS